jgi:DNA (cytosine-5)-methyltransferase 1
VQGGKRLLWEPFVLQQQGERPTRPVSKPLPTITTAGAQALVEPFLVPLYVERQGQEPRVHGVGQPVPIPATGGRKFAVVTPVILPPLGIGRGNAPRSVEEPCPTILASRGGGAVVQPLIVQLNHGAADKRSHSVDAPMPTITGADAWGIVQSYLVKFYGDPRSQNQSVSEPLHTVTAKDRFGLVEPGATRYGLDIRFRMLRPHELAAAMGFPRDHKFAGNRGEQVKQVGNAVAVRTARALLRAILDRRKER